MAFKRSSMCVYGKFQRCFKDFLRNVEWFSEKPLKKIQGRFKGCFKGVSRQFQRHFKKVSRVFKEFVSRKFHKKFQGCFKKVSIEFRSSILLLQGSLRWSPTFPRTWMVTQHHRDYHLSTFGWSLGHPLFKISFPNIVAQLPKDCHPPSKITEI